VKAKAFKLFLVTVGLTIAGYGFALFAMCEPLITKSIYCSDISSLAKYFAENIRGHLFAGFLALGGFLLSLKTFIVVNMKENVYDDEYYKKNWKKLKKTESDLKLYGPLKELSDLLYHAILAAIISAVLQMSLGLYLHWLASIICIWSALYAVALLVWSLKVIKQNLDEWFTNLDKKQEELEP
jgi:hypothetical protein